MNANELMQILEIGGAWEDDSGNLHNVPTGEFEQALSEAIAIIDRTRIRVTAEEKPTEADGNKYGYLLAHNFRTDEWEKVFYMHIADTDETSYDLWTQLPEVTPNETKEE